MAWVFGARRAASKISIPRPPAPMRPKPMRSLAPRTRPGGNTDEPAMATTPPLSCWMKRRRLSMAVTPNGSSWGIFCRKRFGFVDEFRHAGGGTFFSFIFGGHETFGIGAGKDSPNAVQVDGLPILKAIMDVRICGVRNGRFNLRVSVGFRSGNKIGYVEIDSE